MKRAALATAMCACLAMAASALLVSGDHAWAQSGGKLAWTQAGVSSGLHSLNHAATVRYSPSDVPAGSVIAQVYADRDYIGQADVQTSLCWNGTQHCVDIVGRSINSRAFNGLDASQPMYLVHRARHWRGSRPPLYIRGNVTVWYQEQP